MRFEALDSIIWREESVSQFESAISIQQRFCALNMVGWVDFLDFAEEVGAISRSTKRWRVYKDFGRLDMKRLDSVLGRTGTLRDSDFWRYVPEIFPDLMSELQVFRYCPKCIGSGFHSPVHQLDWLSRCVIHGEDLSTRCPSCHRELEFDPRRNTMPLHNYCCVRCGHVFWPDVAENSWPAAKTIEELKPIKQYLRWIGSWSRRQQLAIGRGALDFDRVLNHPPRIDDLKSVLRDVPSAIKNAWRPICKPKPRLLKLPLGEAKIKRIVEVFAEFGPKRVLAHSVEECGYTLSISNAQWYFARHLRRRHRYCTHIVLREISSALHDNIDWFDPRSHCHGYLVSEAFRNGNPILAYRGFRPTRRPEGEDVVLTEALATGGLLKKRSLIAPIPHRYVGNLAPSYHSLDDDLRKVIRFIFLEVFAERIAWYQELLEKADRIEHFLDRDLAMRRLLLPDFRSTSVIFLIYRQSRELVVASFKSSANSLGGGDLDNCDLDHRGDVGHRAGMFRRMVMAEKKAFLRKMKDELNKLEDSHYRRKQE